MSRIAQWARPLAGVTLALTLAGCSSISDFFSWSDSNVAKPSPLVELPKGGPDLREAWQSSAGKAGEALLQPAADPQAVYAAGSDALRRFGLEKGQRQWEAESKVALVGGVGLGGGLALVGNARGELSAFDAETGKPRWTVKLTSELAGVPVVAGNRVVVRTSDGLLRALSVETGERLWQYSRSLPLLALRGSGGMTASGDALFAGFPGGKLVALDLAKGTQTWEATVALPRGASEIERIADVMGAPMADAQRVCAIAYQGRIACFDRFNGAPLWARDASSSVGLADAEGHLYAVQSDDVVDEYDLASGRGGWRQDKLAHRKLSTPLAFGRWLIVGDAEGYVHVLSRADGSLVARARVGGAIVAAPIDLGPGFAVQTVGGEVTAFRLQ